MSRVAELQAEMEAKNKVLLGVEMRMHAVESELRKEVSAKLDDEFGAELQKARQEVAAAQNILRAEVDKKRMEDTMAALPYPEGTVLVEWNKPRYYTIQSPWTTTGRRAVIQVFRQGDAWPTNRRWRRPGIGSIILRILKDDGKPGKIAEEWGRFSKDNWLPEGQSPKVQGGAN